ncbi:D-alanyl-D-alanine carboxypeptidase/D-alanyl-D-alanine endopeptidase [Halobacillus mangrovi]|uniref:D-alanyl-D-alanine carboxypeptidase/D-alanyl-D-alanine-endopeptidase n=1 Tax=Halobacillus mangrovi TaxID=402384 RepID=A0A1W5ZX11_9BACI|nr:D-alanyl-D-alanine carboxypeptidase/D-alanyl-D-alanine-endopeptidase [Halobacillus mangrovi]ARI77838.1 D-alanyl-D-alanine carboxypeptidase/D-alanyl-D-alanine-endopeptidase [Halobacillus mangrovi]
MFSFKSKQMAVLFFVAILMLAPYQSYEDTEVNAENDALGEEINEILADEKLDGALAGVSIRSAETGEVIYEHDADLRLKPASNMKLLTGAAALETLGPAYTFTTEVLAEGDIKGNKLHGDLYLKGKGDPTLMEKDFVTMAQSLKEAGIREVKGNLVADDTWYDDIRLSEDISWNDETNYTGAQISALTASPNEDYDAGTVIVAAYPSDTAGEPAEIEVTPENDYVEIVNEAKTVDSDQSKDISIERKHGTNQIVVEGAIPVDASRSRSWVAVSEPTGLALDLFSQSLKAEGIKVKGKEIVNGKTPKSAELIVSKESIPLEELFTPFMKISNNGHAEVLIKEMGKVVHDEGSWDKGMEVVEDFLNDSGVNADTMRLRDGSGMSHVNMVPANEISNLLYQVKEKEWFPTYLKSLPVAGNSERFIGGTLRYRMGDTAAEDNVRAKTGSLTGVTSLSGYVTSADGEELIFSVLLNNYLGSVQEIEDEIAVTLAEYELNKEE